MTLLEALRATKAMQTQLISDRAGLTWLGQSVHEDDPALSAEITDAVDTAKTHMEALGHVIKALEERLAKQRG